MGKHWTHDEDERRGNCHNKLTQHNKGAIFTKFSVRLVNYKSNNRISYPIKHTKNDCENTSKRYTGTNNTYQEIADIQKSHSI